MAAVIRSSVLGLLLCLYVVPASAHDSIGGGGHRRVTAHIGSDPEDFLVTNGAPWTIAMNCGKVSITMVHSILLAAFNDPLLLHSRL